MVIIKSNNSNEKEVLFKGKVVKQTYNTDNYKIYALDVDHELYPDIKFSKYDNAVICGEIHELGIGIEYEVRAVEQSTKYGYSYKVLNIRRDKPRSAADMYVFLQEILSLNQAETLYNAYPDIVDRVMQNRLEDIDFSKLKGIKEHTFNIIKNKIIENYCLSDLVLEFQGLLSLSMLKKLYDKYTSITVVRQKMKQDPYKCLCGLARVGFIIADSIILEIDKISKDNILNNKSPIIDFSYDIKSSPQRCLACLMYLLSKNEEDGHTLMPLVELKKQCDKLVPACSFNFVECLKNENIYYDKFEMVCALQSTYQTEKYIADRILEGLKHSDVWDYDITKYRKVEDIELSDEQIKIIEYICKYSICILNGAAGCGKSFTTQAIINLLKDNHKTFALFTPTGKASKVVSEYTHEEATTIHRGLGYIPPDQWGYNENDKLMCDVLIIDEFSMTDIFLFKKVLEAIDFSHTKLLLIGDNAQLPSVSCGNLLHDFMQSGIIPTVTLSKVFRYTEGGLMKVATDVRLCKNFLPQQLDKFTWFGDNKDYAFINLDDKAVVKNVIELYKKLLSQGYKIEDIQVLSSYKKGDYGAGIINNGIQKVANPNYGTENYIKVGDTVYFKGDLVIQNVNNYHAKLFINDNYVWDNDDTAYKKNETFIANGETGIITEVTSFYVIINFDGVSVKYSREELQNVGLGYCITIHKSQGSSSKVIILVTPKAHTYMLNSNLIYVGLTRMREKCFHLGNSHTVEQSIKKKANFSRNTLMQKFLVQK